MISRMIMIALASTVLGGCGTYQYYADMDTRHRESVAERKAYVAAARHCIDTGVGCEQFEGVTTAITLRDPAEFYMPTSPGVTTVEVLVR